MANELVPPKVSIRVPSDDLAQLEQLDSADAQRQQQICDSAMTMVVAEVRQFQEIMEAFASSQRERMDMHRRHLEKVLDSLPDRLTAALRSAISDQLSDRRHLREVGSSAYGVSPPISERASARVTSKSSMAMAPSYSNSGTMRRFNSLGIPRQTTAVQMEYHQMKLQMPTSHSRISQIFSSKCGCHCPDSRHRLPLSWLRRFVGSMIFSNTALAVIFLNVIFSIILADMEVKMRILDSTGVFVPLPEWFGVVDLLFLSLFGCELLFRLLAEEVFFFVGEHWRWNLFDLVVVLATAVDSLSHISGPNIGFVRIIRLLRVVRSMRLMRVVRYCHELRVMLLQIMNSLKPMLWAFTFLCLVILLFTLVFTQGVINYFEDLKAQRIEERPETADLTDLCGSFTMSILSLFMSISGGINWWTIVKPLMQVSPVYVCLFLLYILVLMIGVLNIIVGIFVDSATDAAVKDREALAQEELERNLELMKGLESLFEELDEDKAGTISWQQFEELSLRSEVRARFATLEIDLCHAQEVFKLIDADGNGTIALDEFVVGIMHQKGLAKRTDVHSLMCEISRLLSVLRKHQRWTAERFARIDAHFASFSELGRMSL